MPPPSVRICVPACVCVTIVPLPHNIYPSNGYVASHTVADIPLIVGIQDFVVAIYLRHAFVFGENKRHSDGERQ